MHHVSNLCAVVMIGFACFMAAFATPIPKDPPKKIVPPTKLSVPDLEALLGESNWGDVTQTAGSTAFEIDGHPVWFATGQILPDGIITIIWTLRRTEEPCPGSYRLVGKELVGEWGYASSGARLSDKGALVDADGKAYRGSGDKVYMLPEPGVVP